MKTSKDIKGDFSKRKKKLIKILTLTPCNKFINVIFSLILISKIITVHQLVTNVVKITIYSLILETKAQNLLLFFFFFLFFNF